MDRYWLILAVSLEQERAMRQLFMENGWNFETTNARNFWAEKKFPPIKRDVISKRTIIKVEPEESAEDLSMGNCSVSILRPKTVSAYTRQNFYGNPLAFPDAVPTEYENYVINSREVDVKPNQSLLIPGSWSSNCGLEQAYTNIHGVMPQQRDTELTAEYMDPTKQMNKDQLSHMSMAASSPALCPGTGTFQSMENQLEIIAGMNAKEANSGDYAGDEEYKGPMNEDEQNTFLIDPINVSDYDADTDVEYLGAEMLEQIPTGQELDDNEANNTKSPIKGFVKKNTLKKKGGIAGAAVKTRVRKKVAELDSNGNPIVCKICNRTFTTEKNYRRHIQKNDGKCYYPCEFCDAKYYKKCRLIVHVRTRHTKERPHKCDICGKGFVEPDKMRIHYRLHTGEKPCQCDLCGERFHSLSRLSIHRNYHHVWKNQPDKFKCEQCNRSYCSDSTLKYHMKTVHATSRDFMCFVCGKSFKAADSLKYHIRFVHSDERQFKCDQCDKTFKAPAALRRHRVTHQENPEKRFVCKTCDKAFLDKEKLKMHMNVHTGDKPYKCNLCNFSCAFSGNLSKHKKVHKEKVSDQ